MNSTEILKRNLAELRSSEVILNEITFEYGL